MAMMIVSEVNSTWAKNHNIVSLHYMLLAYIPAEGKSSVCLICMKYRIIILIIIIISLDKILSSYIANTSRTHGRTHAHTRVHAHPHTTVAVRCFGAPNHDSVMVGRTLSDAGETMADRRLIEINRRTGHPISQRFWKFFAYKKMLGRTETRTRDRIYCQTMRTVRDISRDDRARIATCSLRTLTDRLKANYSIDYIDRKYDMHTNVLN